MNEQTIIKTYGIEEVKQYGNWQTRNPKSRWAVVMDGRTHYSLQYARPSFAMNKAKQFAQACHKDFINFQGIHIHFEFTQV